MRARRTVFVSAAPKVPWECAVIQTVATILRVKRLLRAILILIFSLGAIASAAMMVRGVYFSDFLVTFLPDSRTHSRQLLTLSGNDQLRIILRRGALGAMMLPAGPDNDGSVWFSLSRFPRGQTSGAGRNAILGFELIGYSDPGAVYSGVGVPLWFVLLLNLLPLSFLLWRVKRDRARKRSPTLCRSCGYDLRAGHERCPECGADSHVGVGASNVTSPITAPSGQR